MKLQGTAEVSIGDITYRPDADGCIEASDEHIPQLTDHGYTLHVPAKAPKLQALGRVTAKAKSK